MYCSRIEFKKDIPHLVGRLRSRTAVHRMLMRCFPSQAEGGVGRTMFRMPQGTGSTVMLVYSEKRPTWENLPDVRSADVQEGLPVELHEGRWYKFALTANPTARTRFGRIRGLVAPDEALGWVVKKLVAGGARPTEVGVVGVQRVEEDDRVWDSVDFQGQFVVQDAHAVQMMIEQGVGRAKAFGFGLLALTPIED